MNNLRLHFLKKKKEWETTNNLELFKYTFMNKPPYRDKGPASILSGEVINISYTNIVGNKYYIKNIKWHQQEQTVLRAICTRAKVGRALGVPNNNLGILSPLRMFREDPPCST